MNLPDTRAPLKAEDVPAPTDATESMSTSPITKGPYLQAVTPSGITVMWETLEPVPTHLWYGPTNDCELVCEHGEAIRLHQASIDGLDADTTYHYAISSPAGPVTHQFRTAPAKARPFRFVVYGDDQTNLSIHSLIAEGVKAFDPDLVLHVGDMVDDGHKYLQWGLEFFGPAACYLPEVPFYPALGNHERNGEMAREFFMLLGKSPWYSFDYANAHFIILDSNSSHRPENYYGPDSPQTEWLKEDLKKNTDATWKFVVVHHPPYSSHPSKGSYVDRRETWDGLFEAYGVNAVFSGHHHCYERTFPMKGGERDDERGVTYVTTSGGGGPLYEVTGDHFTAVVQRRHHHMRLQIDGEICSISAVAVDGEEIDRLVINKSDRHLEDGAARIDSATGSDRLAAIRDFVSIMDRRTVGACLDLLDSSDPVVQRVVLEGLSRMLFPEALDAGLRFVDVADTASRRHAATIVGRLGSREHWETILQLLRDSDSGVRINAAWALPRLAEDQNGELLVELLDAGEELLRCRALLGLKRIGGAHLQRGLTRALVDRHPMVQVPALVAAAAAPFVADLAPILRTSIIEHNFTKECKLMASRILVSLDDHDAIPAFISMLHAENSYEQREAAVSLKAITGQDLGDDETLWADWWDRNKE